MGAHVVKDGDRQCEWAKSCFCACFQPAVSIFVRLLCSCCFPNRHCVSLNGQLISNVAACKWCVWETPLGASYVRHNFLVGPPLSAKTFGGAVKAKTAENEPFWLRAARPPTQHDHKQNLSLLLSSAKDVPFMGYETISWTGFVLWPSLVFVTLL